MTVLMRHRHLSGAFAADFTTTNDQRDIHGSAALMLQFGLQSGALGATRGVAIDGLINRRWSVKESVGHIVPHEIIKL